MMCQHPGCGYQVRITRKWLAQGAPRCPLAGHGSLELKEEGDGAALLFGVHTQ